MRRIAALMPFDENDPVAKTVHVEAYGHAQPERIRASEQLDPSPLNQARLDRGEIPENDT
jgi:hypothetical protein